jgi:hypothetical protein
MTFTEQPSLLIEKHSSLAGYNEAGWTPTVGKHCDTLNVTESFV